MATTNLKCAIGKATAEIKGTKLVIEIDLSSPVMAPKTVYVDKKPTSDKVFVPTFAKSRGNGNVLGYSPCGLTFPDGKVLGLKFELSARDPDEDKPATIKGTAAPAYAVK